MTFPDTLSVGDRAATGPWMVLTDPWFFMVMQFFKLWKDLLHLEHYGIEHVFSDLTLSWWKGLVLLLLEH